MPQFGICLCGLNRLIELVTDNHTPQFGIFPFLRQLVNPCMFLTYVLCGLVRWVPFFLIPNSTSYSVLYTLFHVTLSVI